TIRSYCCGEAAQGIQPGTRKTRSVAHIARNCSSDRQETGIIAGRMCLDIRRRVYVDMHSPAYLWGVGRGIRRSNRRAQSPAQARESTDSDTIRLSSCDVTRV